LKYSTNNLKKASLYEDGDLQIGFKEIITTQKNGDDDNNMQVVIVRKAPQCNVLYKHQ
jgi:hypothetical protein